MTRPAREAILMETARLWSRRSTCDRAHVGAVFSVHGRILMTGYNGAPAGMAHCSHECTCHWTKDLGHAPNCGAMAACTIAVHAEANGIAWAARKGVRLEGCEVHTTVAPCSGCAKLLLNTGIVYVTYDRPHRDMSGVRLLIDGGVGVEGLNA